MRSAPDPGDAGGAPVSPVAEEAWWRISLAVPPGDVEPVAALFERVTPAGVVVEWPVRQPADVAPVAPPPDGPPAATQPSVRCYVAAARFDDALARLRRLLRDAGRGADAERLRFEALRRSQWETAFHRHLRPLRVGRLLLRPRPSAETPRAGEVVVDLEPGLAFGTGDHPTTRMALAALERTVRPGDRVLDFGTGSGVLACAAARLGAAAVLALDVDPQAVAAARRNVALNGLGGVTVAEADAPPIDCAPYDVVVANISAGVIVRVLPALLAAVRPGGRCLLGGIIAPQLARVTRALAGTTMDGQPLQPSEVHSDGEWRGLEVIRPAGLRG